MADMHLVIVPHTHWDREWYMPFERFRKQLVSMMDHLLEVLEHDRAFKYFELDGQTIVLEDYLAIRPANENRLLKLIRQGRILIGPWYVQPDEFLVTGESIIRNLRMGIEVAKRAGKPSLVGYLPDQFGHIAQMPQILAGFGIRSAVVWRGVGDTVGHTQFLWESPDGTRVFAVYLADSYGNGAYLPLKPAMLKKRLSEIIEKQKTLCDIGSILVMNGLDHLEPQDSLPAQLEKAVRGMKGVTFEMGTLGKFIEQAERQAQSLTVHSGEFRSSKRSNLLPGVTSARIGQKQRSFFISRLLERYVEPLCAWASLCGDKRPHQDFIEHAWRLTLKNQPHDSICGCSVDAVHEEMETRFNKAEQIAKALQNDAISFLANAVDSSWVAEDSPALCLYNPTSARSQVVDVIVNLEEPDLVNSLRDRQGRHIPLQKTVGERELFIGMQATPEVVREQVAGAEGRELIGLYINNIVWQRDGKVLKLNLIMGRAPVGEVDIEERKNELLDALNDPSIELVDIKGVSGARTRVSFFVNALAPVGLNVFSLSRETALAPIEKPLSVSEKTMENDFYRVSVNDDGTFDITDKETGKEFRRCLQFVDEGDRGDTYNFDEVPGGEIVNAPASPAIVSIVEDGPVRSTLKLEARFRIPEKLIPTRDSRSSNYVAINVTTKVSICRDIKRIDFRTELDNKCEDHRLRVIFTAPFATPDAIIESTYGVVTRPAKVEAGEGYLERPAGTSPQKTFSCVENGALGMALFNRGIPEIEAIAGESETALALTLVRSVGWLSRDDLKSRPGMAGPQIATPGAQSQGPHVFEYAFTSYRGSHVEAAIAEQAHSYAFPPVAITTNRHKGKIKDATPLVAVDNPGVIVSAVELSQLKQAYLVRLYNTTPSVQQCRLTPWGKHATIYEVNFLEKRQFKEPLRRKARGLELSFRPGEIKTMQVVLKQ